MVPNWKIMGIFRSCMFMIPLLFNLFLEELGAAAKCLLVSTRRELRFLGQ